MTSKLGTYAKLNYLNYNCFDINSVDSLKNTPAASLQMGETPTNECPGYDTKRYDDEASDTGVWGMRSTPSLTLLPGPLWPRRIASDRALSMS